MFDPWTGQELKHGIPLLTNTPGGNVVDKLVKLNVVTCPECNTDARFTNDSEPVCPDCGIICSGKGIPTRERMVRDAKAAGRVD